tara:strand:- start:182 stop:925 length:744 start_codon:yes stop_codon:yes gene_type:complete
MSITLDPNDLAATRTSMGVGDAATKTVGTANGNLIAADAVGLPAINGSQVTNLTAANLTGALPAISGAALTNLPSSGGGAWSVKSSGTFSSTTALEVTNITKTTIVYFTAISQTQNSIGLRTSSNNGTSYDSAAGDYNQYGPWVTDGLFAKVTGNGAFTSLFLQGSNSPDANGFLSGWFQVVQPADTNTKTLVLSMCCSEDAGTTGQQFYSMGGVRTSAAAVNAIKMFHPGVTSSFTSGSFVVCELN